MKQYNTITDRTFQCYKQYIIFNKQGAFTVSNHRFYCKKSEYFLTVQKKDIIILLLLKLVFLKSFLINIE